MSSPADQNARPSGSRPTLSPLQLNALASTYLLALCNWTFWSRLNQIFDDRLLSKVLFTAAVWALMMFIVSLVAVRWLQKPVLIFLILLAAVTSFYMDSLGVMIDREMIQNAVTTTVNEGKHLITPDLAKHVALYGLPASAFVLWVQIRRRGLVYSGVSWSLTVLGAFALMAGILFSNMKAFSTVLRSHKELMGSVQPLAPLAGALRYGQLMMKTAQVEAQPLGRDATKGPMLKAVGKPVLTIVVAGETARAQNWSLGGYERDTNPELAKRDIIYFDNATSCGTATATSLPCMFSHLTRDDYSYEAGLAHENLIDVLSHAGVKVEWYDNNTGSKGIADRVPSHMMTKEDDAEACKRGECIDAVFLPTVRKIAQTMTEDTVIVLHQIGSHGPSYWLRYPEEAEVFKPACHSPELTSCSSEEIVNAYDNTILYTDHFLSQVIDLLAEETRVAGAMYYVSDHGESLGENGIYLHGTPYFMAPETQTRVPMLIWMSEPFRTAMGIDTGCLAAKASEPVSHDNLFSTVLGMMDIQTEVRDPGLDLVASCRSRQS